jgi:hypothetical protein
MKFHSFLFHYSYSESILLDKTNGEEESGVLAALITHRALSWENNVKPSAVSGARGSFSEGRKTLMSEMQHLGSYVIL